MTRNYEILTETIIGWRELCEWVKQQQPNDEVNILTMLDEVGYWGGTFNPLCKEYRLITFPTGEVRMKKCNDDCLCPLVIAMDRCGKEGSTGYIIDESKTWKEWLENSELHIQKLECLREKEVGI